jgi:hypothetical protein
MGRQRCAVLGSTHQLYHVDPNGYVWNRVEGGTAWKNQACYDPRCGVWTYQAGGSGVPLTLIPISKARCKEIGEALMRYATAMQPIPQD